MAANLKIGNLSFWENVAVSMQVKLLKVRHQNFMGEKLRGFLAETSTAEQLQLPKKH